MEVMRYPRINAESTIGYEYFTDVRNFHINFSLLFIHGMRHNPSKNPEIKRKIQTLGSIEFSS